MKSLEAVQWLSRTALKQADDDSDQNHHDAEVASERRDDETQEHSETRSDAVPEPVIDDAAWRSPSPTVGESAPPAVLSFDNVSETPVTKKKKKRHPSATLWE